MNNESNIILELESRWVTREELRELLGGNISDRNVRGFIEELNKKLANYGKCIVSTSARAGYHIPNPHSEDDLRIVASAVEELKSKAISIFERRKMLEDFMKQAASDKMTENEIQLSIF